LTADVTDVISLDQLTVFHTWVDPWSYTMCNVGIMLQKVLKFSQILR